VTVARADNVISVPNSALYWLDGKVYVDVWYRGRAVPTPVEVGLTGGQLTEIKSGLGDGQQVVLSNQRGSVPTTGQLRGGQPSPP
jgi:membrane fusion protein, macrolide-specific efflux system